MSETLREGALVKVLAAHQGYRFADDTPWRWVCDCGETVLHDGDIEARLREVVAQAHRTHLVRALLAATAPTPETCADCGHLSDEHTNIGCVPGLSGRIACACAHQGSRVPTAPTPDDPGLVKVLAAHRLWWIGPYVAKCSCKQWRSTRDAQAEHDAHLAKAIQDARGSLLPALQPTSGPEDQRGTDGRGEA